MKTADIYDVSKLQFTGEFDNQVDYLFEIIRLKRFEVEQLIWLYRDLEAALQQTWRGCSVVPFGSIVTGLGIQTSDVDCYIYLPEHLKSSGDKYITRARNVLSRKSDVFKEILCIHNAKVPIVKFYHAPTERYCDVSFKSPAGVQNSKLIAFLLHMDKRGLHLAILLKYWAKINNLTGTNLMSNYALTMLVIFFLQQENILPPVSILQLDFEKHMIDNWNTAFNNSYKHACINDDTLYQLIGRFFKFYASFNFAENIISPYWGHSMQRRYYKNIEDIPASYSLYKQNVSEGICKPLQLESGFCVQDPFEHNRNCTIGIYPRLVEKVSINFKSAANLYETVSSNLFLKELLTVKVQDNEIPRKKKKRPNVLNRKVFKPQNKFKSLKRYVHQSMNGIIHEQFNKLRKM